MAKFDVIVIGSGPGGYVCAIRAAQLGLSVACIEGRETLGGTCLNVGCIPSKALLHASHQFHESVHNFESMGLMNCRPEIDWNRMLAYKSDVVSGNTRGIEFLFKKNRIQWLKGWGRIEGAGKVRVGDEVHEAGSVVIATGSEPSSLRGISINEETVVTSTGALELESIPESMVVIGAGVIGLELGSVYSRLGSNVTFIEYLDQVTPGMDRDVSRTVKRILSRQGMKFVMGTEVLAVEEEGNGLKIGYRNRKKGKEGELEASVVLVATGRRPNTEGLGIESLGIATTDSGQIKTDSHWKTSLEKTYAIGDVTQGPMLAHKAEDEGIAVAEILAGKPGHVNYGVIPSVIYTHPEVAAVGRTEDSLKTEGQDYKVGKFAFMGNARAKSIFAAQGFVKLLSDAKTDRILGCHLIGPAAGELIHEICVAMEFGASAEDVALTCHAHPTFSEAVREAALACGDGAIHA